MNPEVTVSDIDQNWQEWTEEITAFSGDTFYCDPVNGQLSNPGTLTEPWPGLQEIIDAGYIAKYASDEYPLPSAPAFTLENPQAPIKLGDRIRLMSGNHGAVEMHIFHNPEFIFVEAAPGETPTLTSLRLTGVFRFSFKGLTFTGPNSEETRDQFILVQDSGWVGPCRNIMIEDCNFYTVQDSSLWTVEDWNHISRSGIRAVGSYMTIRNNHFKNVNYGITAEGQYFTVENNVIENFAGDGLRGQGSDMLFEGNTVKNCYKVNANHDDAFQSFVLDNPPFERITLRGNTFIIQSDPNQPFTEWIDTDGTVYRGMQGIGCFDGYFNDWVIENNLIITDHWHGITLLGANRCRIVNNTVLDINSERPGPPWIRIGAHKDGTMGSGCEMRNNVAVDVSGVDGTVVEDNYILEDFSIFTDYDGGDYSPASGSPLIGAGNLSAAPDKDIFGNDRKADGAVDIGAIERMD